MEYFFSQIKENESNKQFIYFLRKYANTVNEQIYLLRHPLIDSKYAYDIDDVGILLMRKHKITFISFNAGNSRTNFQNFVDDVLEDINSLSDTYNYKKIIGRVRTWKNDLTTSFYLNEIDNYKTWIENDTNLINIAQYRRLELVITLFIGSINDVSRLSLDISESIIERVKQKIQIFDGEQTRFIYGDLDRYGKLIKVQGLSGTGKTELLLHKLRDIYVSGTDTDLPIGFTCHNKILADNLRQRIPQFFNFMMVKKQIEWDKLLCVNAWGRFNDSYSGIYRYICHFYDINFLNLRQCGSFEEACKKAISELKSKEIRDYAFSYMFIDESQDFDASFFNLCELVTKEKVFIAGDIFQSIFEDNIKNDRLPEILLTNCYRTDPKTLMIAHALGLGLYEKNKLWWLNEEQWTQCGYIVKKNEDKISLTRYPIHRFDEDNDSFRCFDIRRTSDFCKGIYKLLNEIKEEFIDIKPEDIGIICIDDENYVYDLSALIADMIKRHFSWKTNIAYETKQINKDSIFISNRYNVKGLEFPIVICITKKIESSISYRNTLYTMLTRSFLRSYLVLEKNSNNGLSSDILLGVRSTLRNKCIDVIAPTNEEMENMHKWFEGAKKVESLNEKLKRIFDELGIKDSNKREAIMNVINVDQIKSTDDDKLSGMIKAISSIV